MFSNSKLKFKNCKSLGDPPIFIREPKGRHEIKVGGHIKLPCAAFGAPNPQIKWFVDEKVVHAGKHIQINIDGGLTLQVQIYSGLYSAEYWD